MKLLLISQLKSGTGNLYTIERIRQYLADAGHICTLFAPDHFDDQKTLQQYVTENSIELVIGLHALKSGKLLQDETIPYIIIIGGTDVNQCHSDPKSFSVMTKAVTAARKVIAFSNENRQRVIELWPALPTDKIEVITQGVQTSPSTFSLASYIKNHHSHVYRDDLVVCVCVGSIRLVKNPLYLVQAFSELHKQDNRIVFVLIGHIVDDKYGEIFLDQISRLAGIMYIPGLPLGDTHAAVQQSLAYINCSDSEGMSLAILEAMMLKVPVIVRNIPGNRSIVTHGETGLIYSDPEECMEHVNTLMSSDNIRRKLIDSAATYVTRTHGLEDEKRRYIETVELCR